MSMLRHRFSNERRGGRPEPPLLFCKSVYQNLIIKIFMTGVGGEEKMGN